MKETKKEIEDNEVKKYLENYKGEQDAIYFVRGINEDYFVKGEKACFSYGIIGAEKYFGSFKSAEYDMKFSYKLVDVFTKNNSKLKGYILSKDGKAFETSFEVREGNENDALSFTKNLIEEGREYHLRELLERAKKTRFGVIDLEKMVQEK